MLPLAQPPAQCRIGAIFLCIPAALAGPENRDNCGNLPGPDNTPAAALMTIMSVLTRRPERLSEQSGQRAAGRSSKPGDQLIQIGPSAGSRQRQKFIVASVLRAARRAATLARHVEPKRRPHMPDNPALEAPSGRLDLGRLGARRPARPPQPADPGQGSERASPRSGRGKPSACRCRSTIRGRRSSTRAATRRC